METKSKPSTEPIGKEQSNPNQDSKLLWLLGYYPVRFYVAGLVWALLICSHLDFVNQVEGNLVVGVLHFFQVYAYYLDGQLFFGNFYSPLSVTFPLSVQVPTMIFFLTLAVTARTNIAKRLQILLFGAICFFALIVTEAATLLAISKVAQTSLFMMTLWTQMFVGALVIELTLLFILTIPKQKKIKRVVHRSYLKEYLYLAVLVAAAAGIVYFLNVFLNFQTDHPIVGIVTFSGAIILFFAYTLAFFVNDVRIPDWLKLSASKKYQRTSKINLKISFLLPAYNEERNIRKCIESIDNAASKYQGETEIVLVNDGSTDMTATIAGEAMKNLKHCSGKLFTITNSGKGFALAYGLVRTTGDVIFRMDADSIVDRNALGPLMAHFRDPLVGSVGGFVIMPDEQNFWVKTLNLWHIYNIWQKRGQDLFDSVITQSGSCSVFRKDALIKVGGWTDNIFGEDGELTTRMARFGYKNEYEHRALMFSESPPTLLGQMHQRARWGVAYYHSRFRNIGHVKELHTPRSIIFLANLVGHGHNFIFCMIFPYLLASVITGTLSVRTPSDVMFIELLILKLVAIRVISMVIEVFTLAYYIRKLRRDMWDLRYIFPIQFLNMIIRFIIRPQVMEVLLHWSTKWKEYNDESFRSLRKQVSKAIDPEYPSG